MFTQEDMQTLLSFEGPEPVISLYLDTDGARQPIETIKQQARGLLREVDNGLKADADQIEQYLLHEYDWSQPGLVVFCSKGVIFSAAIRWPFLFVTGFVRAQAVCQAVGPLTGPLRPLWRGLGRPGGRSLFPLPPGRIAAAGRAYG
jgi:hypothetical protein